MFFLLTGSLLQEEVKPWVEDIKEQNRCSASALLILKEDEMVFSRICTLGNLHLRRGNINGQQIVPKEVIEIATQVQSPEYKSEETPLNGAFWYVQGTPSIKSEIWRPSTKRCFSNNRCNRSNFISNT